MLEKVMFDNDSNVMQNKKQETDFISQGLKDRQKEEKYMLGQIYQNQINQTKQIRESEKQVEKELEKMQIDRMKAIDPDAYNKLKKKAYQQEVRAELDQKNKFKQYDQMMREHSVRETKKNMDMYASKEMNNEQEYRRKFKNFDSSLEKRMKDYNDYVMKPQIEKESKLSRIERNNIKEYNKKLENDEIRQHEQRKMQLMQTSNEIKNQMHDKSKMKQLSSQLGQIESDKTNERAFEITTFDQMLKDDKKKRQEMYRQMLNSQVQYNKGLKSFGIMTKAEKDMNKDDLEAYKRFDKNQYGMIPGISNEKKYPKPEFQNQKIIKPYNEPQRGSEAHGYGRYLKKVPSSNPIDTYSGGFGNSRAEPKAFNDMNRSYTGNNQHSLAQNIPAPQSRRHQNSGGSPRSPDLRTLRNAGVISMSRDDGRAAGSPSGMGNPYRSQVL